MRDLSLILIKEAASTVHLFRKSFIMIGSPLYNFCKTEVESSFANEQKTFGDLLYFRLNKNILVKTLTLKTIFFGEICEGEDNVFFNHLFIKILYSFYECKMK